MIHVTGVHHADAAVAAAAADVPLTSPRTATLVHADKVPIGRLRLSGDTASLEEFDFRDRVAGLPPVQERTSRFEVERDGELGGICLYVVLGAAGSSSSAGGSSSSAAPTSPGRGGARSAAGATPPSKWGDHEAVSCGAATLWTSSNMDDGVIDGNGKSTTASSNWSNVVVLLRRSAPVREGDTIVVHSTSTTGCANAATCNACELCMKPRYAMRVCLECRGGGGESIELDSVEWGLAELYPDRDALSTIARSASSS